MHESFNEVPLVKMGMLSGAEHWKRVLTRSDRYFVLLTDEWMEARKYHDENLDSLESSAIIDAVFRPRQEVFASRS